MIARSRRQREILDEIGFLLSEHSLAKWPSFLEEMCEEDELMGENIYSNFTFAPLQNLHFRVPTLLKKCLIQYFSSDETYSQPWGSNWKAKKVQLGGAAAARGVQWYNGLYQRKVSRY